MKKLLACLMCICFLFYFNTISYATDASLENDSNIISENVLSEIKEEFDLTSETGKKDYLKEVFGNLGVNERFVDIMNEDLLNKFVNSEKIGCTETETANRSSVLARGNVLDERYYDNMHLVIIWSKNGNVYSVMGGCEWLDLPIMKADDIISLDFGGGSVVGGSQLLVVQYEQDGIFYEEEYDRNDDEYKGTGTACVFEFNLPNSSDSLVAIVGYDVKSDNIYNTISLQYFHAFLPSILNISISASYYVGISISPNYNLTEYNLQTGTA